MSTYPMGRERWNPTRCVSLGFLGDEEDDRRDVLHPHPQPHIGVRQVYLAEVDWPETRVGGKYLLEDVLERTPKAHCLHVGYLKLHL